MDSKALAARLSKKYETRDPFRLADEMGFIVVFAPLIDMRGFQQRVKRQNIIYINDALDERQQALVCGHEMGHHFMHRGMNRIFMNLNTQFVTQKFENEANLFSLELIFADEDLQPFLNRSITDAATFMGVSVQLATWRMETVPPYGEWAS
jgi:Zn-dependent peptidase ImmA (M78 family)